MSASPVHLPAIFAPTWGERWMVDAEGQVMRSREGSRWELVMRVRDEQIQPVANALDLIAYAFEQGREVGRKQGDAERLARIRAALEGEDE